MSHAERLATFLNEKDFSELVTKSSARKKERKKKEKEKKWGGNQAHKSRFRKFFTTSIRFNFNFLSRITLTSQAYFCFKKDPPQLNWIPSIATVL